MQNDVLRCKTTSDEKFGKRNKTQKKRYDIKRKSTILYTLENAHNPEVVGSSPASATRSSSRNGFRYDYFFVLVCYVLSYHKSILAFGR